MAPKDILLSFGSPILLPTFLTFFKTGMSTDDDEPRTRVLTAHSGVDFEAGRYAATPRRSCRRRGARCGRCGPAQAVRTVYAHSVSNSELQ